MENDERLNLDLTKKTKSSSNLRSGSALKSNYLNTSNLNRLHDKNYDTNINFNTALNFGDMQIKEIINENNSSEIIEGKYFFLNLGRLYDEKDRDRSKSPKLGNLNNISHLSTNKGHIKNIEINVIKRIYIFTFRLVN